MQHSIAPQADFLVHLLHVGFARELFFISKGSQRHRRFGSVALWFHLDLLVLRHADSGLLLSHTHIALYPKNLKSFLLNQTKGPLNGKLGSHPAPLNPSSLLSQRVTLLTLCVCLALPPSLCLLLFLPFIYSLTYSMSFI